MPALDTSNVVLPCYGEESDRLRAKGSSLQWPLSRRRCGRRKPNRFNVIVDALLSSRAPGSKISFDLRRFHTGGLLKAAIELPWAALTFNLLVL